MQFTTDGSVTHTSFDLSYDCSGNVLATSGDTYTVTECSRRVLARCG